MQRDPAEGCVTRVVIEAVDEEDRRLRAVGTPVSKMIINRHTFIDINSLIRWDLDGDEAWGEDQDMWPITTFADRQRQARVLNRPVSAGHSPVDDGADLLEQALSSASSG